MIRTFLTAGILASSLFAMLPSCRAQAVDPPGFAPGCANPILPGYYADPSILQDGNQTYIYATLDPWGDKTLGCWQSSDFKNWTYRVLNWPTKQACTSPTSGNAMVWAPSVVRGRDGKFYMYLAVGNEVWTGTADNPLGPWRNPLGNKPLIPKEYKPGFHMIDPEAFIDDDGQAYLYWGSGLNWVNGRCWAVKLKADMKTFDGEVVNVTPPRYFEAPFMIKHGGRYYLMFSEGNTMRDTYQVDYAVGPTPLGPFKDGGNNPILATNLANSVVSPGHHAVFTRNGQPYILYHRQSIPFNTSTIGRQVCVDRLEFTPDGGIAKVVPTHIGPPLVQGRLGRGINLAAAGKATASSQAGPLMGPERAFDDNYATRWAAAHDAHGGWLQVDLGQSRMISRQEIRVEFAWKPARFAVQSSSDGQQWTTLENINLPIAGSPVVVNGNVMARYLRLFYPADVSGKDISVFEWLTE